MVTFTALITYIVVLFIYLTATSSINDFFGVQLLSKSLLIPFAGILVLYLVNIFFGLLPIFTLLRKTPSETLKYMYYFQPEYLHVHNLNESRKR